MQEEVSRAMGLEVLGSQYHLQTWYWLRNAGVGGAQQFVLTSPPGDWRTLKFENRCLRGKALEKEQAQVILQKWGWNQGLEMGARTKVVEIREDRPRAASAGIAFRSQWDFYSKWNEESQEGFQVGEQRSLIYILKGTCWILCWEEILHYLPQEKTP